MRALVITAPGRAEVQEVSAPTPGRGEVVVDVDRAGICGTDIEIFHGEMAYLRSGHARFPMRIGHEWTGVVASVGEGTDTGWIGRRVMGDTMLGCGSCRRCRRGNQHVCAERHELGIRGGRPGALAEQAAVPASSLHELPRALDPAVGAMVEPAGNALRAVEGAQLAAGDRVLILGPGTIGLLCALLARDAGAEVHLLGVTEESMGFARELGFEHMWTEQTLPELPVDAVIDAATSAELPARALQLVEPGGRVVYIGLASSPSQIDTRELVLGDLTAVGVLSASPGLPGAIAAFTSGNVDPRPLVAATTGLDEVAEVLAGTRPTGAGPAPKIHIDPSR